MLDRFKEPRLADLLQDPLTGIVMARDGISQDTLMSLLIQAAARTSPETHTLRPDGAVGQ